jgi:DNA-binding GntR family transcriptional regulator
MVISKRPLREQIRDEVLSRLLRGDYPVGTRINEGMLADDLGVSRTPLREALATLAAEGVLELRPNRGFWLSPVTADEIRETYPIIGSLEVLALRSSDPTKLFALAPKLIKLADEMRGATPRNAGTKDDHWHNELLRFCPNQRLLHLIRSQKTVVHRYELAYFQDQARITDAAAHHRRIAEALLLNKIDTAAHELRDNWEVGMQALVGILGDQPPANL